MGAFNCSVFSLLTFFLLASAFEVDDTTDNYVVGGRATKPGQFPSIVSLRTTQNQHRCGGFILSDRWIASAASCVSFLDRTRFYIIVGSHQRFDGHRILPARVIFHPNYEIPTYKFDIAVIQTQQRIGFNDRVQPIRWPQNANVPIGRTVRLAGWGLNHVRNHY